MFICVGINIGRYCIIKVAGGLKVNKDDVSLSILCHASLNLRACLVFACLQTFTVSDDDNDDVHMINEMINFDQTSVAVLFFDMTGNVSFCPLY